MQVTVHCTVQVDDVSPLDGKLSAHQILDYIKSNIPDFGVYPSDHFGLNIKVSI